MKEEEQHIVKDYGNLDRQNPSPVERKKLGKHMMHLIRLYLMCLDILERGEIVTYREKEHDFLMDIRKGTFLDENDRPIPDFFELVSDFANRVERAKEHSNLPEHPDYEKIQKFMASVNERIVTGEIGSKSTTII